MEWIEQFNQAIALLETVLPGPVEIGRLAQAAGCSAFHFQRLFAYLAGMPLSEYIRRRRMSLAAADLQAGARVLDVALRCGYASPTAFNRAFRQVHGIPPSQARLPGAPLRSYPPIRLQIAVQGGTVLEFRVEKREAFPFWAYLSRCALTLKKTSASCRRCGNRRRQRARWPGWPLKWMARPRGCLASACAKIPSPGAITSPSPVLSLPAPGKPTPFQPARGPFSQAGARPAASSSWKGVSSQNGCPLPAMNTLTRPTWRSTKTQTRATPSMRSGSLWPPSHKGTGTAGAADLALFCLRHWQAAPSEQPMPSRLPRGSCPFLLAYIPHYYNKFGQESRAASPAFPPSRA